MARRSLLSVVAESVVGVELKKMMGLQCYGPMDEGSVTLVVVDAASAIGVQANRWLVLLLLQWSVSVEVVMEERSGRLWLWCRVSTGGVDRGRHVGEDGGL
ncbi:hypothetical protein Dimus_023107 [Dionaea muscipula]